MQLWGCGAGTVRAYRGKIRPQHRRGIAMESFHDRERAFESKFAHDAEMQFRAIARRNKRLGLWAAELLGKSGDEAEAYAMEVIRADFDEAGHEDVFRKVAHDLGHRADEPTIRAKMETLLSEVKAELAGTRD